MNCRRTGSHSDWCTGITKQIGRSVRHRMVWDLLDYRKLDYPAPSAGQVALQFSDGSSALFDDLWFDPFAFEQDGLAAPDVDLGRGGSDDGKCSMKAATWASRSSWKK